jgi:hypothetical protein
MIDKRNDDKTIAYAIDEQGQVVLMHDMIWEHTGGKIPAGYMVSHINGDGLDNRRSNLCLVPDWNGSRDRLVGSCLRAKRE